MPPRFKSSVTVCMTVPASMMGKVEGRPGLSRGLFMLIFAPVDIEALVGHVEGLFKYQILI